MKIVCVGRNYSAHARELGNEKPDQPVLFLKPDTAALRNNADFYYPPFTQNLHFECEVFFRFGKAGKFISQDHALGYLDGVGLGIDFTARDLQQRQKEKGLPWEIAKAFTHSAPISRVLLLEEAGDPNQLHFRLSQNGESRQQGRTADWLFKLPELIAYASQFFTFTKGDLLFTGTPEGVGPVQVGDHLQAWLGETELLNFNIR